MTRAIHSTAVVDASARIGEDVEIGPGVIVQADTVVGDRCHLLGPAVIRRYTTLGEENVIHPFTVLGGEPQDHAHDPGVRSFLRIGSRNVFREGVTLNRATGQDNSTIIGDDNYFMAGSHIGHNGRVGSHCVLTNGSGLGGYAVLADRVILSSHVMVHQFCWVGRLAMTRGNSGLSMHLPPYCLLSRINLVTGLNSIGLRRSPDIGDEDRRQIVEAYKLLYRRGLPTSKALVKMDAHTEWGPAAAEFRDFLRRALQADPPYNRGLCTADTHRR